MATDGDAPLELFFIDSNRSYRGPVNLATMAVLLKTQAISTATYVYGERVAECNGSWVRLRKLPKLLESLQPNGLPGSAPAASAPPLAAASARPAVSATPPAAPAAAAPAATPVEAAPAAAASAPAEDAVPRQQINPTAEGAPAASGTTGTTAPWSASQGAGAAAVAAALQPSQPRPPQAKEPLFTYFPSTAPTAAPTRRSSTGHAGAFRWFGSRSKGATPKSGFGAPLLGCTLDAETGVPEVLTKLRSMLFAQNGHLVEGIFRVSPSSSVLKAARQDAEANRLDKISDPESMAQLIKLYFRALPQSVLAPRLEPIVDGPPEEAAACAALVEDLPEPQRSTVRWMLQLFRDVASHEGANRMTIKSMCVVFAPNLVDPPVTMPPMLALELNGRVVTFLERCFLHRAAVEVS